MRARPEQALQQQVAQYLTYALGGSAWFTCFPSGGGGLMRGKILRGMGLKAGVPDILILDGGRTLWIELKAKRGYLSPVQIETIKAIHHAGGIVDICRSLDEVIAFLELYGVPLKASVAA